MNLKQVRINEGFWKNRKDINKNVSFYSVLKSFEDTGRVRALTKDLKDDEHHHIFWESDLAKLMESAFFMLHHQKDDKLIEITENIIDKIINNQEEDGYLNSYFSFYEPQNKFTNLRVRHELYCAGHLLESAVEHKKLNGESSIKFILLCMMLLYIKFKTLEIFVALWLIYLYIKIHNNKYLGV